MKRFLKNILYFILGFFILNIAFYFIVFKPAIFEKYIFNEKDKSEYNLFLVSDSHGAIIENTPNESGIFNLSYSGDNYFDMYLKIKHFSNSLSKNDTILLSIDNHQLSSYRDAPCNIDLNIIYCDDVSEINSFGLKKKYYLKEYLPYLPLCYTDLNKLTSKFINFNLKSYKMNTPDQNYSKLDSSSQKKSCVQRYNRQFDNRNRSGRQIMYLEKIIKLCKKKEIQLIGVKFPITKRYWDMISRHDYGAEATLRNNNIDVIDFHDLFFNKDVFFKDQDHLNTLGGALFCQNLLMRIQSCHAGKDL